METYDQVSYRASRLLTLSYSSSFGLSSKLFSAKIRKHIYAIYAVVRIADEIVDTYNGSDREKLLAELQSQIVHGLATGYSTNPIVHAFCRTARRYHITEELFLPFFDSMKMDLSPKTYTRAKYKLYIYGSAEVIGLMCLRVFCSNNEAQYKSLSKGARALGSAYQKVNFLRDMASDYKELGRTYFPNVDFDSFDEDAKQIIIQDIKSDFSQSNDALKMLPRSSRIAVATSYAYYVRLLHKLEASSVETIKSRRIRVSGLEKLLLLAKTAVGFREQL